MLTRESWQEIGHLEWVLMIFKIFQPNPFYYCVIGKGEALLKMHWLRRSRLLSKADECSDALQHAQGRGRNPVSWGDTRACFPLWWPPRILNLAEEGIKAAAGTCHQKIHCVNSTPAPSREGGKEANQQLKEKSSISWELHSHQVHAESLTFVRCLGFILLKVQLFKD